MRHYSFGIEVNRHYSFGIEMNFLVEFSTFRKNMLPKFFVLLFEIRTQSIIDRYFVSIVVPLLTANRLSQHLPETDW